jgi:hypothetical protein
VLCSSVRPPVENDDGWQVEAIAGRKVFACREEAERGSKRPSA